MDKAQIESLRSVWRAMKRRCCSPARDSFKNYGGRGITICDEWKNSFEQFAADVGPRPSGTSIDRIDNDKGYYKDNVRWATRSVQNRNNRRTVRLHTTIGTISMKDACHILAVNYRTALGRFTNGEPIGTALSRPQNARGPNESHHSSRLTVPLVCEICATFKPGLTNRAIGKMFGVSMSAVRNIRAGVSWPNVKRPA